MKRLDKILNDGEQERATFSSIDTDINCDCCSGSGEQSSTPVMNGKSDEREPTLKAAGASKRPSSEKELVAD